MKNDLRPIMLFYLFIFLFVMYSILPIRNAEGHAIPLLYYPQPGSHINNTLNIPKNVSIFFTEKPEANLGFIHVFNPNKERIDFNNYTIIGKDKNEAVVSLDKNLILNGKYVVFWTTTSSVTGYITKGTYTFYIDTPKIIKK